MAKGRCKPGESGNPRGRKPGAFSHASIRSIVGDERFKQIINNLADAAQAGDPTAINTLLQRIIAPRRATMEPIEVDLPEGEALERAEAVVAHMAAGALPVDQGKLLMESIIQTGQLKMLAEYADRLERLERRLDVKN